MHIALSRPKGYSDRVFLLTVKITDPRVVSNRISFEVPIIDKWFFRQTERNEFYVAPLPGSVNPMRGVIINGEWECIAQSNGVSEEDNPMSREAMKESFFRTIETAVRPFQEDG